MDRSCGNSRSHPWIPVNEVRTVATEFLQPQHNTSDGDAQELVSHFACRNNTHVSGYGPG